MKMVAKSFMTMILGLFSLFNSQNRNDKNFLNIKYDDNTSILYINPCLPQNIEIDQTLSLYKKINNDALANYYLLNVYQGTEKISPKIATVLVNPDDIKSMSNKYEINKIENLDDENSRNFMFQIPDAKSKELFFRTYKGNGSFFYFDFKEGQNYFLSVDFVQKGLVVASSKKIEFIY